MTAKRRRQAFEDEAIQDKRTSKAQRLLHGGVDQEQENGINDSVDDVKTPTKRRRGRPPGSVQKPTAAINGLEQRLDPSSPLSNPKGKLLFVTPVKPRRGNTEESHGEIAPVILNTDRSARRKSVRTLIQRTVNADSNDENDLDEGDALARAIWDIEDAEESDEQREEDNKGDGNEDPVLTPSKRPHKQRLKARRKRTPTPPQDIPPHELYFFQNRAANAKTSNNTLSSLSLLTHEQYHNQISAYKDPHASSLAFLHSLHSRSFPQWNFELSQAFNICLYGYGSKRHLLTSFATHLHSLHPPSEPPNIIIINGYTPTLTIRQILTTIATQVFNSPSSSLSAKIGSQPREVLTSILTQLTASPPTAPIYIFINSLDALPLRRPPNPSLLALLAAHPHIRLLATCDTPTFPLLWDAPLHAQYNFLYHDTTTFAPYASVEIGSVVDDVNELLGRSGRNIKGKEGVGFVLKSLPENARNLYRVLIAELLAGMDGETGNGDNNDDEDEDIIDIDHNGDNDNDNGGGGGAHGRGRRRKRPPGVEYRVLYQKVVEEFICTSEMAFRALLQEFHDHQMVVARRDGAGTEMLAVPFRREEMEAILGELVG